MARASKRPKWQPNRQKTFQTSSLNYTKYKVGNLVKWNGIIAKVIRIQCRLLVIEMLHNNRIREVSDFEVSYYGG